jgi:PTS system mannose-specific IID component
MKKLDLLNIFFRSLAIQASFNFERMQNLAFTFAMIPLIRNVEPSLRAQLLDRHMQMFNTHPYLAAQVIGSVTRLEEEGDSEAAGHLKKAVMGPYAAIGDPFFWGALRPLSAICSVILALQGCILAPLAFLILYNPAHAWVRGKGFIEGYRQGKNGIDFIRRLDLPGLTRKIRFLSLIMTGILAAAAMEWAFRNPLFPQAALLRVIVALILMLFFFLLVRRGITPLKILYGMTLLCMVFSFSYD